MKKSMILVVAVFLLSAPFAAAQDNGSNNPPPYITKQMVQQSCPYDLVVWLDMKTGLYYAADQHRNRYARTVNGNWATGEYICWQNAQRAGAIPANDWQ